mmetsp:Transcript_16151/g.37088  ORF Transcript_16151/g.37088 Transcript_16151/m.37088 type:complete len:80 (+) Transcript_16151:680-919(+)
MRTAPLWMSLLLRIVLEHQSICADRYGASRLAAATARPAQNLHLSETKDRPHAASFPFPFPFPFATCHNNFTTPIVANR